MLARFAGLLLAGGCVVGEGIPPGEPEPEPEPEGIEEEPEGRFGLVLSPKHGEIVAGETSGALIALSGLHEQPGYRVDVQVLSDPADLSSWETIVSDTTAEEPAPGVESEDLYRWSAVADPTAGGSEPARWPQGGLLRVRAVGERGEILTRLYADETDCATASPRGRAQQCGDVVENGLILVSPETELADDPLARPAFLVDKGVGSPEETAEYYETIGAPETVEDFRTRFGFDAAVDPVATYFNIGDLATGREIRCRPYTEEGTDGVACLTSNYRQFSADPNLALDLAIEGTESGVSEGAFAFVAMVYVPPVTDPNSVQFMVYGADGALVNEAELDTHGDNPSIPQNCINCHGSQATYDPDTNQVLGARFLPFDPKAFLFSTRPGYTRGDQEEAIRQLNQVVYDAGLSLGSLELLDEMYGGRLDVPGTAADEGVVAPGWTGSLRAEKTYKGAVAPFCRACHASREQADGRDDLDFTTAGGMRAKAPVIASSVCGETGVPSSHRMPNAQVVVRRFWSGPGRAYLADFLDIAGSCAP